MQRKPIIIVFLVLLALLFTAMIWIGANRKYTIATKTVEGYQAAAFIAAGAEIKDSDVKKVKIPESASGEIATGDIVGKSAVVSMVQGQYIYTSALSDSKGLRPGYVAVRIPTDLSSSAGAITGDTVDICAVNKGSAAQGAPDGVVIYESATVLSSVDNNGNLIAPGKKEGGMSVTSGTQVPAAVEVEVPKNMEQTITKLASSKSLYLAITNKK